MRLLDVRYVKKEDKRISLQTVMPHELANFSFTLKGEDVPLQSVKKSFIQPMFAMEVHFVSFPLKGRVRRSSFLYAYTPSPKSYIAFFSPKLLAPLIDELPEESVVVKSEIRNAQTVLPLFSPLYNLVSPDEVREYWHQAAFVCIEEGDDATAEITYILPDNSKALLICSLRIEDESLVVQKKELLCFKERIGEQMYLLYE